ncbi:ABC transporter substrate-binding protein [Halocella sp. SP3-1]|uniref:ABC transporter substrate-binding protein n=1 Tax=Halocella sp. SP3-1 TaxID=2382161 RepID=UPI000F7656FA|nr:ABC transporter substrate-binding protein [Halocella sp. SP3-1]AZO93617.1 carbohydrate ABC transporter substrate-binding protein [Halocella sp. SP3-1]
MKKYLSMVVFLMVILVSSFVIVSAGNVEITLVNSKEEIQTQLEEAAEVFESENPGISLEVIPAPAGQSPYEKVVAMYASGNAPTLAMLDPGDMPKFAEKFMDLSSQKWAKDGMPGAFNAAEIDGKLIGFPLAIEGYAFIYNKKIVEKAVNGDFDPSTIKTRDDLERLFQQIEDSGVSPLHISPMDWSLGQHYLAIAYIAQSKDQEDVYEFLDDLKAGKVDLANNKVFNGLMETFDVMKKYNIDKNDPLSGTYDRGAELLGLGKVAIWFMGNWAWPSLNEFDPDGQYGFLAVPISNKAADFANSSIVKGSSKFIGIDKEQSSKEERAAAQKFLNWLIYSDSGQDVLVNKMNIIPAYKSIELEPADPLAKSITKYMVKAQTIETITLPADHWSVVGASMQKYLAGYIDKAGLAKEVEAYWKTVK